MPRPERRQPLAGRREKFNLISILSARRGRISPGPERSESVDAAERALYKTGNGGGRNPAAAIL
jgi:hypothetical protein